MDVFLFILAVGAALIFFLDFLFSVLRGFDEDRKGYFTFLTPKVIKISGKKNQEPFYVVRMYTYHGLFPTSMYISYVPNDAGKKNKGIYSFHMEHIAELTKTYGTDITDIKYLMDNFEEIYKFSNTIKTTSVNVDEELTKNLINKE